MIAIAPTMIETDPPASHRARPWGEASLWAVGLSALFLAVYGGCNTFTASRHDVGTSFFAWELRIPFVPVMIVPYNSIDAFFFLAPFICVARGELRSHAKRVIVAILVAGVCFLAFPLKTAFVRPDVHGAFAPIFRWFWAMDRPFNLAPSLHIALRGLIWVVFIALTRGVLRNVLKLWFVLIGVSTLLTYQHHLIDLATGVGVRAGRCTGLWKDQRPLAAGLADLLRAVAGGRVAVAPAAPVALAAVGPAVRSPAYRWRPEQASGQGSCCVKG